MATKTTKNAGDVWEKFLRDYKRPRTSVTVAMPDGEPLEIVLEALSYNAWQELLSQHPPLVDHRRQGVDHNPETFPPAAVAACCVDPEGLDVEAVGRLQEMVPLGQWVALWRACLKVNVGTGS